MSKLYDVTIMGDDTLGPWMAAAAFAGQDLRVAFIIAQAPDPGLPGFFQGPLDPSRVPALMGPWNLKPARSPFPPFLPDYQLIVAGSPLDVISDPEHAARTSARDFKECADQFQEAAGLLDEKAGALLAAARENRFPDPTPLAREAWPLRFFNKTAAAWAPPPSPSFASAFRGRPALVRAAVLGLAAAGLAAPLPPDPGLSQVALLFHLARALHHGPGAETDFREQAAARIAKRGAIIEAEPEVLLSQGRTLESIRLQGGAIVDTRVLVTSSDLVDRLLGQPLLSQSNPGPERNVVRTTFFYKLERPTVPDALALRAAVVRDPEKPLTGDNFLILVRSPRVPRRETLAVTWFGPPANLAAESVPALLASTLTWLDPAQMAPDDTREPRVVTVPAIPADLAQSARPAYPLENLLPLPSEILPAWGPLGVSLALTSLSEVVSELIKKYKTRSR